MHSNVEKHVIAVLLTENQAYPTSMCQKQSYLNHNQMDVSPWDMRIIQLYKPLVERMLWSWRRSRSVINTMCSCFSAEGMPTFSFTVQCFQIACFDSVECKSCVIILDHVFSSLCNYNCSLSQSSGTKARYNAMKMMKRLHWHQISISEWSNKKSSLCTINFDSYYPTWRVFTLQKMLKI